MRSVKATVNHSSPAFPSRVITLISLVAPVLEGELHCATSHYRNTQTDCSSRIIALMLGRLRMDVDTAINAYNNLVQQVFSDPKRRPGDGRFKATKFEEVIKSVVRNVTGDPEGLLLEVSNASICRT
jgi:hypothetical protein